MTKQLKYIVVCIILLTGITPAQLYFFGRNKVQYDKFDWKVLRTKHFDIYYYGQMEEIASIGASIAEETFTEYKSKFDYIITHRIPLIFYNTHNQFEQTNTTSGFIPEGVGGFFEFMKGRVVIPYSGSLHDFRHVIMHELVHVFMTTKLFRILKDHRISSDRYPPLWFTEGLAEYISTTIDGQARMVMRDAVLNNYFVNLENIYRINGTFQMYKEGQNFLTYVADKYGPEKVMQFLNNFWMYQSFNKVIEHTLGESIKKIDEQWEFYLKRKYYPLLGKEIPPQFASKKLTGFGFNFSPVFIHVDKKDYLYFEANRDGYSSLYRLQINVKNQEKIKPEIVLQGEKSERFEAFHLFQSSIDASKDGIIAFVTKSGPNDVIHFFSANEGKVFKTFGDSDLISIASPKFSQDGNSIVFQAVDQKGFSDIYMYNILSGKLTRLTNDYYDDRDPCFGINDNQIIFTSDRTAGEYKKTYNLFALELKTHKISYVTYLNTNNYSPRISPDKKFLLFTSGIDGVRNLWSIKIHNGKFSNRINRVTGFITSSFDPSFIDSTHIAFAGFEKFAMDLYELNLNKNSEDTAAGHPLQQISMRLDSASGKWTADIIKSGSIKEKYKYKNKYSLDYAVSQVSTDPVFGTRGGAILSLSDLLSNDIYNFLIYNTAQVQSDILKSFNIELQRINLAQRTNYGYGVFHFSGNRYDIRESQEYFYERSFGGYFILNFPLSKFARIQADVSIANSDKQIISGILERKALLMSNSISYVFDNSLWGPTGPLDGTRARILLGYTGDVKYSNVNYFSVIADYRHYFRLSYRSAFAVRAALFYNQGKEARRYFMGGSWSLRGWPRWSIRGEKMWITSFEYRFPLIDELNIKFPFLNLGFFGIRGATFFDAGNAWDTNYKSTLGSVGAGIRINLLGAIVFRYDVGKKIENNFADFQKGLFYQFFFGWDF